LFLFAVTHPICQYFDPSEIKIGTADISQTLLKTTKALNRGKTMQKGEKKQIFGTGLNLALVLP